MKMTEFFLEELDREVERSRGALEQVPDGKYQWKPHDKSMIFGYLADMVATMPSWIGMAITRDELDIAPTDGSTMKQEPKETNDEFLGTNWRLLAAGNVVQQAPRHEMIRDAINHWAHHRGQMTVYLRLMGAKVPALYGPSADDKRF